MKTHIYHLLISALSIILCCQAVVVEAAERKNAVTQIEIIFDDSGSMWGQIGGKAKIEIAKEAFNVLIDDIFNDSGAVEVGLRVYGHLNKRCDNTVLEVPIAAGQKPKLKQVVSGLKPLGMTPITASLEKAASDFDRAKAGHRIIVLLTDGIESCAGDPCAAAKKLQEAGAVTKVHVVGLGMNRSELDALACIAAPSKGLLIGANDAKELNKAFEKVVEETVTYNLEIKALDDGGKPLLADYAIFPSGKTDQAIATGDTSMNQKALLSLPAGIYDIEVVNGRTKKSLWLRGVAVEEKKRTQKEVAFGEREIKIYCKNQAGAVHKLCDVYVYDKAGAELKHVDTSMGYGHLKLEPGIYDIKVINYASKKEGWLRDVDTIKVRSLEREIVLE